MTKPFATRESPMDHTIVTCTCPNEAALRRTVETLIRYSQWFSVEPRPDDVWQVCVKRETGFLIAEMEYVDVPL